MTHDLFPPVGLHFWQGVNQNMIAKALRELTYEEVIDAKPLNEEKTAWQANVGEQAVYTFSGKQNHWGDLTIEPSSICRNGNKADDALAFFGDLEAILDGDPLTWSTFLTELHNTLLADLLHAQKLQRQTFHTLDAAVAGHPKLLANKGRLGWGYADIALYGTESENPIQFFWVAIKKDALACFGNTGESETLLAHCMNEAEQNRLKTLCPNLDDFLVIPVHPWQWQHWIIPHFLAQIQKKDMVALGKGGDFYRPQMSLRTFSNLSDPKKPDVKLSLSVLNTSSYRGIPKGALKGAQLLSGFLANIILQDPWLSEAGTRVQRQLAAVFYQHPFYETKKMPYHFKELLGAVWRQSAAAVVGAGQQAVPLAALLHENANGTLLLQAYLKDSGLDVGDWLQCLFDSTAAPLYHLLCTYGLSHIAHGQNITLILEQGKPSGMLLKDFHGDMRLVRHTAIPMPLPADFDHALTIIPPEWALADWQTSLLGGVFRYLAPLLAAHHLIDEPSFYRLLRQSLLRYQKRHPNLHESFTLFDIWQPTMAKVCVNKVRLQHNIAASPSRPLPELGKPISNPLWSAS